MLHFHKSFIKDLAKSPKKIQQKARVAIDLFQANEFDSRLNNHSLKGAFTGCRSINITADYRIVYKKVGEETICIAFRTHSELYT